MRILFSCTSGDGHLYPMLPLAKALQALGHEVAFAMAEPYADRVEAAGLTWLPAGIGPDELHRRMFLQHDELVDLPLEHQIFISRFALGDAPDRAADLHRVIADWSPDLLISEPCDLAGPPEAAAAGVPIVLHSFGRPLAREYYELASPFVAPLWRAVGLEPRELCGVYGPLYVDICPPSLRGEAVPIGTKVLQLRPTTPALAAAEPAWLTSLPDRPTVYVTLGTIFNAVDRFPPLLSALGGLECNVIVTIGRDNDPSDLAPIPANAVVERFIPQDLLLPHVDVMVGHGGSGSMLAALARGIPALMLPAGADQFENADACHRLGLARVLLPHEVTPDAVRDQVAILLSDESYQQRARALAEDIARMPEPCDVAAAVISEHLSSKAGALTPR